MRIGVDCYPLQDPASSLRGIGRYSRDLLTAMIAMSPGDEWFLYGVEHMPFDGIPRSANAWVVAVATMRRPGEYCDPTISRAVERNPQGLDAFLVLSPVQSHLDERGRARIGRTCAVHYDLIPEVFPDVFLADARYAHAYETYLTHMRWYDSILTMSGHAKVDLVKRRHFSPMKITIVGAAANPLFRPSDSALEDAADRATLKRLGIHGRYILNAGNEDPRKGSAILARAFAMLPEECREGVQLVYAYPASEGHKLEIQSLLTSLGLPNAVGEPELLHELGMSPPALFVGWQSTEALRALYRNAVVMAFPSGYEGFGLPILEAQACGCPVIAGNNSSQPEVQYPGGPLVPHDDPEALSTALQYFLADDRHVGAIKAKGLEHARTFRWDRVADRALGAVKGPRLPSRMAIEA